MLSTHSISLLKARLIHVCLMCIMRLKKIPLKNPLWKMITSGTANNINGSSPSNPAANKATLHFTKISCFHQVEGEGIIDSTKQVRKFVIQSVPDDDDSLFRSIRGFLVFGKIIGVLPFSGVFGRSSNELSFK